MSTSKNRKLAAILFADIVGYTALMQKDEITANQNLEKFHQTLHKKVEHYKGQIINNYGDGCVCTFDSAVDAMYCAKDLQSVFQESPKVPVRIGLHSGDVFFKDDNVYGDSVNIASRIESLGVAGAVLFSKQIKRHIANQTEFKVQSVGEFDFKNVEKTMKVFALANEGLVIPKAAAMQGKLKLKKSAPFKWLLPMAALLILATGILFWQKNKTHSTLPQTILESRIAVIPYENNTNDPNFDALGDMAADWIANSLLDLEDTKVVMYDNIKDHLALLSEDQSAFTKQTGAEQLVRGKFYQEGDELIFESKILNPISNEVLYAFPLIRGNRDKPSEVIGELSQRITGFFAANEYAPSITPPTYEAFKEIQKATEYVGKDYDKVIAFCQKAIELDPTFETPYSIWFFAYWNRGQWKSADSVYQFLKLRFPNAQNDIDNLDAFLTGNLEKRYKAAKRNFEKDPKYFISNYNMGRSALRLNRPQTTLKVHQHLDPTNFDFDFVMEDWWYQSYARAYMQLKQYDKALSILNQIPPSEASRFDYLRAEIYVQLNQSDSLELLVQKWENGGVTKNLILTRLFKIAFDYGAKGDKPNQLKWGRRLLNRIKNRPESVELPLNHLGNAYFILEDYENMLSTYEQVKQKNGETWDYLVHVGFAHAKLSNTEMANAFLKKYQDLENPYAHGKYKYAQAMIYAGLGKKEEAMRFLQLAFKEGYGFTRWDYNCSYELSSLRGYPPFEEFVKPKG